MAAPDASAGSDGLPYIGSLMSLVSQGEVRYTGTLWTIDMPNSTIALSNVRCYGTEGRRKEGEVPPSDQIFEYVVFKGAEIKELTVLQPPPAPTPPPPAPPAGFSDPAIVSAGAPPPGTAAGWGAPPPPGPQPYGAPPPFGSSPWGPPPPGAPGGPPPPPGPPAPPPPGPPAPPAGQPAPAPAPTVTISPLPAANGSAAPPPQQRPSSYAHAAGGRAPLHQRGGRGGGRGGGGGGGGQGQQGQGTRAAPLHAPRQQQPRPPPVEVPKEEFDFEEALKKFNKAALEKEAGEEHVPAAPAASTYSKDDFFDQLSCDTLERLADGGDRDAWRSKMAAQRRVDVETFGGTARAGGSYRGRGRGRGGRGYYRGGRGGRGGGQQQQ